MKVVNLKIEKTAFGGEGIGFFEGGKACFVEGALPGETVSAKILSEKKNFAKAHLLKILKASSDRIQPPCPYYEACGGCQYQHVSYPAELKFKETQAREILSRQAGIDASLIRPIESAGSEYGYRNSVTLHVSYSSKKHSLEKKTVTGFIGRDNRTLVPIQNCLLADPRLSPIFSATMRGGQKKSDRVTFKLSEKGDIISDQEEIFFKVHLKGVSLLVNSKGFFQNNLAITELIADRISRWVREESPEEFFDLYAGAGTFTFLSAGEVPRVVCIEESPESIKALKMNRDEKHRESLEVIQGKVEMAFPEIFKESFKKNKMIFMDPPRQGIAQSLARFIARDCEASSVIYLSCDPTTLARDLKIILSGGKYKVLEAVPFDMFPKTSHIEVLVKLKSISI